MCFKFYFRTSWTHHRNKIKGREGKWVTNGLLASEEYSFCFWMNIKKLQGRLWTKSEIILIIPLLSVCIKSPLLGGVWIPLFLHNVHFGIAHILTTVIILWLPTEILRAFFFFLHFFMTFLSTYEPLSPYF